MAHQMNLFAPEDDQDRQDSVQTLEGNALDEMFAASRRFRSSVEYLEMLHFIVRCQYYSAFNGLLLYLQNPSITYVATAGTWRKRYNRYLKSDAKPLIILAPMSPVRFVYDVSDTEGDYISPQIWASVTATRPLSTGVFENTLHNCRISGILVREIQFADPSAQAPIPITREAIQKYGGLDLDAQMNYLVLLEQNHCREVQYASLAYELAQIFCGHHGTHRLSWWQSRPHESDWVREIEAESAAFLVCRRQGLLDRSERFLARLNQADRQIPPIGLNAVLAASSYIEDMGKTRWKKPKKQGRHGDI
jgi:hypothetical protein